MTVPVSHQSPSAVNRAGEMAVFVAVVERSSFSAAARRLGMTPSAVSKLVLRLEQRLGVQLVRRSTRHLSLTGEGREFYERSVEVLAAIDEAERSVAAGSAPRGRVTINSNVPFGMHVLIPLVPALIAQHPALSVDITLTDRLIDLVEERCDIAIRWGKLDSSELVARRLGQTAQAIVASPAYLERRGTPRTLKELEAHQRLGHQSARGGGTWPLRVGKRVVQLAPSGTATASDGEAIRGLALVGAGLARLSLFHVQRDLDAGTLVPVLQRLNPGDLEPIHAVYVGKSGRLPARIRAVLDFLEAYALPSHAR